MARALGRYELLRPLARGGMADVYLARRRGAAGVEKRLVVKRIRHELAVDPRFVQLFVKEARLSMELAHANIVPVFDFGRVGDDLFLAMEYVQGRDLGTTLARARERGTPLDPVLVAHLGAEVCQALDYAHRRRIVHQDVTPRNILLSFSGEVKLVDFGVASLADDAGGRLRGTPAYMSPEQARGGSVDARSDLFSLALILAEALLGARVHDGRDAATALEQARAGRIPPLPPGTPEGLREAVAGAAQPDPSARFADARALQQVLDRVVVEARAADPARSAPSHELALRLRELFPESEDEAGPGERLPDGAERAITFRDDGDAVLSRALGIDDPGSATVRSMAETMGEETAAPPPPPARWRRWAAAGVVALGAAGVFAFWPRTHDPPPAVAAAPTSAVTPDPPAATPAPPPPAMAAAPPARDAGAEPAALSRPAARSRQLYPVEINARPWAQVYIDGRYVDDTPFKAELSAGPHRLQFRNPVDGGSKTRTIQVPRDRKVIETLASP